MLKKLLKRQCSVATTLVIGDLHCGSRWGLFPRDFCLSTGGKYKLNKGQDYLLNCFDHAVAQMPEQFDILFLNGDIINGPNYKGMARDQIEQDPEWQIRAALKLLKPIAERARETYVTQGSSYHVGVAAEHEESLARSLGAKPDSAGHHAWDWLLLDIGGVTLDMAHAQSVFTRYRSTPLEREIQFASLIAGWGGDSDIVIRSHTHTFSSVNVEGQIGVSVPSWQLQTRFARRSKTPSRYFSKFVGGVRLDIFPDKKEDGFQNAGEFIKVVPLLYRHPPIVRPKVTLR